MKTRLCTMLRLFVPVLALAPFLPAPASAHWCHDNWDSAFNLTVKPETDSVTVPASGSAQMVIWVQNNMGYALEAFALDATATGFTITVTPDPPTVAGHLMPGEKQRHLLTISKTGGDDLSVESFEFFVTFGGSGIQSSMYGNEGAVMIKKNDGIPFPAFPGSLRGSSQALHHRLAAQADFGNTDTGLNELLQYYCAGRRSWDHTSSSVISQYCTDTASTLCSDRGLVAPTKYDLQRLWATYELAIRKSALGARLPVLRERLKCGCDDTDLTFVALAAFTLGYLGEDAGARAFLEGMISAGSADQAAIAKASLLLMGNGADLVAYGAEVTGNMSSGTPQVAYASAAALAIAEGNDLAVTNVLLTAARWYYPGSDSTPFLASHLLGIVAWDRRGWVAGAGDTGTVTFYRDAVPPAPGAPDCRAATVSPISGEVPLTVTLDASGCSDPDGDNLSYSWTIEDTEYDEVTTDHTFDEPGNYPVRLTVTDDATAANETIVDFDVVVNPVGGGEGGSGGSTEPDGSGGAAGSPRAGSGGAAAGVSGSAAGFDGASGSGEATAGFGGAGGYDDSSDDSGASGSGRASGSSSAAVAIGTTAAAQRDDSGSCCVVVGSPATGPSGLLAALLAGAVLIARRRRR